MSILLIDEGDKSVGLPSSKGQLTVTPSGEELPELAITEQASIPKPRRPKGETLASSFYQQMDLQNAVPLPNQTKPDNPSQHLMAWIFVVVGFLVY